MESDAKIKSRVNNGDETIRIKKRSIQRSDIRMTTEDQPFPFVTSVGGTTLCLLDKFSLPSLLTFPSHCSSGKVKEGYNPLAYLEERKQVIRRRHFT